ncbi:MAG: M24 family metallopeptidase [bacterium]|nr:M24 family metallopeptidase [bacterium]
MSSELDIKTERLLSVMDSFGCSGVLLNGQHNFAWITGGANNGVDQSRDTGVASILITRSGERFLLANKIEMPRMLSEEGSADDFEAVDYSWQDEKSSGQWLIDLARDLAGGSIVTDIVLDASTQSVDGSISAIRRSLTQPEIVRFTALGQNAAAALDAVIDQVQPGHTEIEIAAFMRSNLERHAISSLVTLVAADDRIAKYRHPVPTAKKLEKTVMLVTCARRQGLIASLTRVASIGPASTELIKRTESAAFVNASLCHATREGVTGSELYDVAAKAYGDVGFPEEIDKHHQGGAAGYRTREWVAHPNSTEVVGPDQAFAWNPSITGTKVEETVIVSRGHCNVVTASARFPQIVTTIDGTEYHSPGILEI